MRSKSFPRIESSVLVFVDIQERLVRAMDKSNISSVIRQSLVLADACLSLKLPIIVSEQYPKGLGATVEEMKKILPFCEIFEKTSFSCFGSKSFTDKIDKIKPESLIICGLETHVCVQQTALDALSEGFHVFVPADAVSSRNSQNRDIALNLMLASGIAITSVKSLVFSLLKDAAHPSFKEISKILR